MEPDENDTVVIVEDNASEETPVIDSGDNVVIIDSTPASTEEVGADPLTERLVNLERDVQEIRSKLWDAEGNAQYALYVAEQAAEDIEELAEQDEEIVEAVDEAIVESIEEATDEDGKDAELEVEDDAPTSAKVHPLFRPASDWFGKS